MEGIRDDMGNLQIKRKNVFEYVSCPYHKDEEEFKNCSDECALFGEPETCDSSENTKLELCHRTLIFEKFNDKRQEIH